MEPIDEISTKLIHIEEEIRGIFLFAYVFNDVSHLTVLIMFKTINEHLQESCLSSGKSRSKGYLKNLVKNLDTQAHEVVRSHWSFTFILHSDWSTTKQKVYVSEII